MCAIARHKFAVLSLYRMLLRESRKVPTYSFRTYFLRRIKDQFRENKCLEDPKKLAEQIRYGEESLQVIRRQAIVGHLYNSEKLAVEK